MPDHKITLETAKAFTKKFRENKALLLDGTYAGKEPLFEHATIDRAAIDAILAQKDCVGLRVYLGLNSNDEVVPVYIGVDTNDNELIDEIMDDNKRCPPTCDPPGTLQL